MSLKKIIAHLLLGMILSLGTGIIASPIADAATLSPEEKQLKKDEQSASLAEKKLEAAQSDIDSDNLRRAERDLGYVEKTIAKFSDGYKTSDRVITIQSKYNELMNTLTKAQAKAEQEQALAAISKRIELIQSSIDSGDLFRALSNADIAERYYENKVDDAFKSLDPFVAKKAELDAVIAKAQQAQADRDASKEAATQMSFLRSDFSDFIEGNDYVIGMLYDGKSGDVSKDNKNDVEHLIDGYDAFVASIPAFKEKFAPLIQDNPDYLDKRTGLTLSAIIELMDNALPYRDNAVRLTSERMMDEYVKDIDESSQALLDHNVVGESRLDNAYTGKEESAVTDVKNFYRAIGSEFPKATSDAIAKAFQKLRETIESVADKNKFDDDKYSEDTRTMKRVAQKYAEEHGMALEDFGADNESWTIVKNALGIPLRKEVVGAIVLKKKGEPVLRQYKVVFTRVYNGNEYEDVGEISVDSLVTPLKD